MFWLVTTLVIFQVAHVVAGDFHKCPAGYATRDNRICYKIYTSSLNRNDASSICESDGGTLASVPSAFDNSYIVNEFLNNTTYGMAWLGITCENTLDSCKNDDNTYFGPYQNFIADKAFGLNKCVHTQSGEWHPNVDCSAELPFICELPTENFGYEVWCGSCYRYVEQIDTSMEADAACTRDEAHLVSIHCIRVDDRQEKTWFDNSDFVFNHIGYDDPKVGDCYYMDLENGYFANGTWIRESCNGVAPYVCKTAMQDIYAMEETVRP